MSGTDLRALKKIKDIEYQNHVAAENNDSLEQRNPVLDINISEYAGKEHDKLIDENAPVSVFLDFDQAEVATRSLTRGFLFLGGGAISFKNKEASNIFSKILEKEIYTEHGKRLVDFLKRESIDVPQKIYDVTQLHYLINQSSKHDLSSISEEYLGQTISAIETKQVDLEAGDLSQQIVARMKATVEIGEQLLKEATEKELLDVYNKIDFPLFSVLSEMEGNGILLNKKYLQKYQKELEKEISQIEQEISSLYDGEINLRSSKQVGELLFEKLKLPAKKKTKTGYSTDSSVLEDLDSMGVSPVPGLFKI